MPKLRRGRSGHKMVVTNGKLMVGKKTLMVMITVGLKKEMVVTNGKLMVGKKNLDDGDIGCGNHDGGVHHNLYFTKGD